LADIADTTAWLIEEWMSKLASSVEMMTEAHPGLTLASGEPANISEIPDALWYSISLSVGGDAAVFIGAVEDTWMHVGKSAMLAAGMAEAGAEDARSAYLEILTQATSGLAQSIGARLDKPAASLPARMVKPGEDGLDGALDIRALEITVGEPPARKLYLAWSHALKSALAIARPKSREVALPERSRTLDLLMEVELPVSVSFGRAQLPLRDVLKLNSGSIVELNRTITDPVEIIVNNCVIARGEVVVVEGNYGVRIQQVISREERLRTLK
jgi:flagellar motor switch protein FliN